MKYTNCHVCDTPLIKQYVILKTGKPLSESDHIQLNQALILQNNHLECIDCGFDCFSNNPTNDSGYGYCLDCGGDDLISTTLKVREVKDAKQLIRKVIKYWSCSIHGAVLGDTKREQIRRSHKI